MRAEFQIAADEFAEALSDYTQMGRAIADANNELADLRQAVQAIEDDVRNASGHGEHAIDGKNIETRAAQLRVALRAHPAYERAASQLQMKKLSLATREAERADAQNRMSLYRRAMDMAIAETNRDAAVRSAAGTEMEMSNAR